MNKHYGIIYKAENLINGKIYIGQTIKTLNKRMSRHYASINDKTYFHNALKKYSKENWKWEIIDYANSLEELDEKEKYWIKFHDTFNNKEKGYNMTSGGNGNKEYSDELKQKISNGLKGKGLGRHHSAETKIKIGKGNKNKIVSKETKEKMSKSKKGKKLSEEHKQKISKTLSNGNAPNYGKKFSNEHRKKIGQGGKGRIFSEETHKLWSEQRKGGKNSQAKQIICLNNNKIYECINDVCKELNVNRISVRKVCKGEQNETKGYKFKYYLKE